jgi:hypothetical protein
MADTLDPVTFAPRSRSPKSYHACCAAALVVLAGGCVEPQQPRPKDPEALMAEKACEEGEAPPKGQEPCEKKRRPPGPKGIPGRSPGLPGN